MRWIGYLISDVLLYPCSITIQILSPWSMARIYLLACLYFLLRRWLKLLSWITVIYSCWKLFGIGRWANNSYIIFIFKSLRMLDLKCFKLKELWFSMLLSCLYSAFLFSNLNWSMEDFLLISSSLFLLFSNSFCMKSHTLFLSRQKTIFCSIEGLGHYRITI